MQTTILFLALLFSSLTAFSQPVVGRDAAAQYFGSQPQSTPRSNSGPGDHFMALHVGKLVNSEAWKWGQRGREKDAGSMSLGVTYRVSEWYQTDFAIRLDFNEYDVGGEKPQKLSFLPMIFFPEASSQFPLYFGAGMGPGIFFKQLSGESSVALDYQLVVGIRFFDVFENVGFLLESGLKNHIMLGDDGQLNSAFITTGAVFSF